MSDANIENMICGTPYEGSFQGVTIWLGDGLPIMADDTMTADNLREYVRAPLQRAIVVARLRALADMLDYVDPLEGLAARAVVGA